MGQGLHSAIVVSTFIPHVLTPQANAFGKSMYPNLCPHQGLCAKEVSCSVIDEMRRLVDKFPEGYEGWVQEKTASGELPSN